MKKIHYIAAAFAFASLTTGCNDWLDVTPRSEIKSDILYQSEDGYKQALNGAYIKMGEKSLYGKDASMLVPEFLARNWQVPSSYIDVVGYNLSYRVFTEASTEKKMEQLFGAYYNAIAQLNDILLNLQGNSTVTFQYNNDQLIEGEALGLRAFLHLDVLRMWGPVPEEATTDEETIPYITEITNDPSKLLSRTWSEVVKYIETDLNSAENLLKECDPVTTKSMAELNSLYNIGKEGMPKDEWQMKRSSRFNYYAVLATKARFYHWIGDKEKAARYAKMVIDSEKIPLCTGTMLASSESLTMYPEHIFSIENINLLNIIKNDFASNIASFRQTENNIKNAYEATLNVNDIRYANNRYWNTENYPGGLSFFTFFKFIGNDKMESDKRIPLIRMAEMYLILIENLPLEDAKPYFSTYRIARGMLDTLEESAFKSEEALLARLEKEYRKEFFGEGQMYYFYKRHNYDKYTWPSNITIPSTRYKIPLPKGQINFQ